MSSKNFLFILGLTLYCNSQAQSVDSILTRHIAAIGGTKNWSQIKTLKVYGTSVQGAEIEFTSTIAAKKAMRLDMMTSGFPSHQVMTVNDGWMGFVLKKENSLDTVAVKEEYARVYWPLLYMSTDQLIDYSEYAVKKSFEGIDTTK
jgi:hypothetical protein